MASWFPSVGGFVVGVWRLGRGGGDTTGASTVSGRSSSISSKSVGASSSTSPASSVSASSRLSRVDARREGGASIAWVGVSGSISLAPWRFVLEKFVGVEELKGPRGKSKVKSCVCCEECKWKKVVVKEVKRLKKEIVLCGKVKSMSNTSAITSWGVGWSIKVAPGLSCAIRTWARSGAWGEDFVEVVCVHGRSNVRSHLLSGATDCPAHSDPEESCTSLDPGSVELMAVDWALPCSSVRSSPTAVVVSCAPHEPRCEKASDAPSRGRT